MRFFSSVLHWHSLNLLLQPLPVTFLLLLPARHTFSFICSLYKCQCVLFASHFVFVFSFIFFFFFLFFLLCICLFLLLRQQTIAIICAGHCYYFFLFLSAFLVTQTVKKFDSLLYQTFCIKNRARYICFIKVHWYSLAAAAALICSHE